MKANNFYKLRLKSAMALLNAVFVSDSLRRFALDVAVKRLYRNLVEMNLDGRTVRRPKGHSRPSWMNSRSCMEQRSNGRSELKIC